MLFRTRYNVLFRQFRLLTAQAGSIPAAIRLIFENCYKLLLTMLTNLPEGKRFLFTDSMNREPSIWAKNDSEQDYNQEIEETILDSLSKAIDSAVKGAEAGAKLGEKIPVIGPILGAIVGGAFGFLSDFLR